MDPYDEQVYQAYVRASFVYGNRFVIQKIKEYIKRGTMKRDKTTRRILQTLYYQIELMRP